MLQDIKWLNFQGSFQHPSMSVSTHYPAFKLMLIRCIKREVAECRRCTIIKLLMQFTLWGRNPQFYDVFVINVSSGVSGFMQQNCAQIALLEDHVHKWPVSSSQSFVTISLQLLGRPLTWVAESQMCTLRLLAEVKARFLKDVHTDSHILIWLHLNWAESSITTTYQFS